MYIHIYKYTVPGTTLSLAVPHCVTHCARHLTLCQTQFFRMLCLAQCPSLVKNPKSPKQIQQGETNKERKKIRVQNKTSQAFVIEENI